MLACGIEIHCRNRGIESLHLSEELTVRDIPKRDDVLAATACRQQRSVRREHHLSNGSGALFGAFDGGLHLPCFGIDHLNGLLIGHRNDALLRVKGYRCFLAEFDRRRGFLPMSPESKIFEAPRNSFAARRAPS